MITKQKIEAFKKLISEGQSLISDKGKINAPECEAWKTKCLYTLKRIALHGIPDVEILNSDCAPQMALAQLQIACTSASNWLIRQDSANQTSKQQGKVILCLHCGNKTYMNMVSAHKDHWGDDCTGIWSVNLWCLYFCPVCSKVTLEHNYTFSENEYLDDYGNMRPITETTTLYPHSSSSEAGIPIGIRNSFEAAQKVRHIDGAICALSLRRTLEMVCKDKGETVGNLFTKLQNLSKKGVLPQILDRMASVLRELGNVAAHADDTVNEFPTEFVPDLIEFTDIILNYLYVLPSKIQNIQSKINNQAN